MDEHRVGLKPILRKVWVKPGVRPCAKVKQKYQWTYVYGFVRPATGETFFVLLPEVSVVAMNLALEEFAKTVGASRSERVVLVLDRAGWHTSGELKVPEGIELWPLPPRSPELQPAERLWLLVDEVLVNKSYDTIQEVEAVLADRYCILMEQRDFIRGLTRFWWWTYYS